MPPALVPLGLIAIGVPAACRAVAGRPRSLAAAWLAAGTAAALAQAVGELLGVRVGLIGDAQVLLAAVGALLASGLISLAERRGLG